MFADPLSYLGWLLPLLGAAAGWLIARWARRHTNTPRPLPPAEEVKDRHADNHPLPPSPRTPTVPTTYTEPGARVVGGGGGVDYVSDYSRRTRRAAERRKKDAGDL